MVMGRENCHIGCSIRPDPPAQPTSPDLIPCLSSSVWGAASLGAQRSQDHFAHAGTCHPLKQPNAKAQDKGPSDPAGRCADQTGAWHLDSLATTPPSPRHSTPHPPLPTLTNICRPCAAHKMCACRSRCCPSGIQQLPGEDSAHW